MFTLRPLLKLDYYAAGSINHTATAKCEPVFKVAHQRGILKRNRQRLGRLLSALPSKPKVNLTLNFYIQYFTTKT